MDDARRKLTLKDVHEIQRLYNLGIRIPQIAKEYGVSYCAIRYHVSSITPINCKKLLEAVA